MIVAVRIAVFAVLSSVLVPAARADDIGIVEQVTAIRFPAAWNVLEELEVRENEVDPWRKAGVLQQASAFVRPLEQGGGRVGEWFVDLDSGRVAVAVDDPPDPAPPVGARVVVRAVPAGVLSATSRDGVRRSWPLMVGRFVEIAPSNGGSGGFAIVLAVVLGMLVVWMFLVVRGRSAARATRPLGRPAEPPRRDVGLPSDPAEALSVLAERRQDSGGEDPSPEGDER